MKSTHPPLSIIILSYNEQENLAACLRSLAQQTDQNFEVVVVDNASTDGSAEMVRHHFPHVRQLQLTRNGGYGAGNNAGLTNCFARGAQLALLLNADTIADKNLVRELVTTYHSKVASKVGLVQAVVVLAQDHSLVNTIGNASHYCGFGYCRDLNKPVADLHLSSDRSIISASGACLLVSREYFHSVGQLNEEFFMYHEDQNYSWRGLLMGYRHLLSHRAVVYHKYSFSKNPHKMFHSEKNRWLMLLENYQIATLLLLVPLLVLLEFLLLFHALLNSWLLMKLKSYGYLLGHWSTIMQNRANVQATRTVTDGELLRQFDVRLDSAVMPSAGIQILLNPVLVAYHRCLLAVIGT